MSDVYIHQASAVIEEAYIATHQWIKERLFEHEYHRCEYDKLDYQEVLDLLEEPSSTSAAAQFHTFFPAHYFKAVDTIQNILSHETLVEWLQYNPRLCIVDIGCGAGAGSTAFISTVIELFASDRLSKPTEIHCLGIDPNSSAVAIYHTFLQQIQAKIDQLPLTISCDICPEGIPQATGWLIDRLSQIREAWRLPYLPHTVFMQINVVSPLSKDYEGRQSEYHFLESLGVLDNSTEAEKTEFGFEESRAYKNIFESGRLDHMHVVTISTNNRNLAGRVKQFGTTISSLFTEHMHSSLQCIDREIDISFQNFNGSRFKTNRKPYLCTYHVNVTSVANKELKSDLEWNDVLSLENLHLAWARARQNLMSESLVDEVELRLFDNELETNLANIRLHLNSYAETVLHKDDFLAYKAPKNLEQSRPRGLSTIEAEVISVAIIQRLGGRISRLQRSSYAYKISGKSRGRDTEYLYIPWFSAFKKYLEDARTTAQKYIDGAVIRVDIKSFYTMIEQNKLAELSAQNLSTKQSKRIEWLLKVLFERQLDDHLPGRGIAQGDIGSGFWANIYLSPIDIIFGEGNEWDVKYFRFVDDIILIVPNQADEKPLSLHVEDIKDRLKEELCELRLELNEQKTEVYYDINQFIEHTETDTRLEQIADKSDKYFNRLWIMDQSSRQLLIQSVQNDDLWWRYIDKYSTLLLSIGIYENKATISRRIHRYIFDERRRKRELDGQNELQIPDLSSDELEKSTHQLIDENQEWVEGVKDIRHEIGTFLRESWERLSNEDTIEAHVRRQTETRLRFSLGKLNRIGMATAIDTVMEILLDAPWLTKEPLKYVEGLARQGHIHHLKRLFTHYKPTKSELSEYMVTACLKAIRYLPELDDEDWGNITHFAVDGTLPQALMATESWISLAEHTTENSFQLEVIQEIDEILRESTKLPNRLAKNYIILIGVYEQELSSSWSLLDDSITASSLKMIDSDELNNILVHVEPSIIRKHFYSGKRNDDPDYDWYGYQ